MRGIVVGGNIRCFLKLAGTEYMPELNDKILLLESFGGTVAKMETYLCQLKQIGAFDKVAGIILGTFTEMDREKYIPTIEFAIDGVEEAYGVYAEKLQEYNDMITSPNKEIEASVSVVASTRANCSSPALVAIFIKKILGL